MSECQTGWTESVLIEMAEYINGAAFKPSDWVEDGLPIIRIEQINKPNSDTDKYDGFVYTSNLIDSGDLIFSWSATLKVVIWNGGPAVLNQHLYKVVPKADTDKYFLRQLLDFNMDRLSGQSQGSTMKHVTRRELSKFRVRHPKDPEHQKKIAAILETVDEAIEATEALIGKYEQVKAGMMQDLFTRGLTPDGKLRPPRDEAPDLYQNTPIGWIPKDWEVKTLNDMIDPNRPICYGILMPGYGFEGGVPVVKVKDIRDRKIAVNQLLLTDPEIDRAYRRSRLQEGDILFTIRGTVGRVAIASSDLEGANITQDTARIAISEGDSRFVSYFLESNLPARFIDINTLGVAVQGINLGDVRKIPIVGISLAEQTGIADRIASIEQKLNRDDENLQKLRQQKAGLMADLLTGKVPVTV